MEEQTQLLDQFGHLIVQHVRDALISGTDRAFAGKQRDIYSQYLYSRAKPLSPECQSFIQEFTPNIVDTAIAVFLQLFDIEDSIRIMIRQPDDSYINLLELTDSLEAEYRSSGGWATTFTNERTDSIQLEADKIFEARRNRPQQGDT